MQVIKGKLAGIAVIVGIARMMDNALVGLRNHACVRMIFGDRIARSKTLH